ncbi:MAG: DUF7266 family protein [Candidatus Syntropharchaeales archaeon]
MKQKSGIINDEEAVSTTLGYLFLSGIAMIFLAIVMVSCVNMFVDNPARVVMRTGFTDVGNEISTKIVDIYIICPDNGTLTTDITMPAEIGGEQYEVNAAIGSGQDQMIEVASDDGKVTMRMTINGIAESVSVTGSAMSGEWEHQICYNSS